MWIYNYSQFHQETCPKPLEPMLNITQGKAIRFYCIQAVIFFPPLKYIIIFTTVIHMGRSKGPYIRDTISNNLQMSYFITHHLFQEYIQIVCVCVCVCVCVWCGAYFPCTEILKLRWELSYPIHLVI
jgi:hypothetical protein